MSSSLTLKYIDVLLMLNYLLEVDQFIHSVLPVISLYSCHLIDLLTLKVKA